MTPEEYESRIAELEAKLREVESERDCYLGQVRSLLPAASPEERAEWRRMVEEGFEEGAPGVWAIIEELERGGK